jgi:predicted amidohydrolase
MAVDPWGEVLAVQASGEAVLLIERDAERQAALRQRMPVTRHRRFLPARLAERQ